MAVSKEKRMAITGMGARFLRHTAVGCLGLLVFLGGCATQKDIDILQRQIWAAHGDLKNMDAQIAQLQNRMDEKLQELTKSVETNSQPLRKNQAVVGAELDQIQVELNRLNGRLEETGAMTARQGEKISQIQQKQMASMLEMQKALDDLSRRLSRVAQSLGLDELAVGPGEKLGESKKGPETGQTAAPEAAAGQKQAALSPEELYAQAFQLFRSGDYQAARAGFTRYLELYPKTELADNSQFWMGECYYAEKRYREAITAYEKTIKDYPNSDKVSSALLKEGMAFLELGDKTAAKILLKKVVKDHPESNQAQIAQRKIAQIE
jgi:tol-pal system protein YbgF